LTSIEDAEKKQDFRVFGVRRKNKKFWVSKLSGGILKYSHGSVGTIKRSRGELEEE
jgi:hypothetical protein